QLALALVSVLGCLQFPGTVLHGGSFLGCESRGGRVPGRRGALGTGAAGGLLRALGGGLLLSHRFVPPSNAALGCGSGCRRDRGRRSRGTRTQVLRVGGRAG